MTIGLSIWVLVDSPSFDEFLDVIGADVPIFRSGIILLIVDSSIVFLVTLFGCCGAAKENRCLLTTYSVSVLVIIIVAIVGVSLTFTGNMDVLRGPFLDSLERYDPDSTSSADKDIVNAWDSLQQDVSIGTDMNL